MTRWSEEQYAEHMRKRGVPGSPNKADVSNPPFAPVGDIVLDLPPPVSVNRSRRIDWRSSKKVTAWLEMADKFLEVAKMRAEVRFDRIPRYELYITLSEDHVREDPDNLFKLLIDFLHKREITKNDSKNNVRKIVMEWGHAPAGARIRIVPLGPQTIKDVLDGLEPVE